MKVEIEVTTQMIANTMCAAVEGNHMVRAWCGGLLVITGPELPNWYAEPAFYDADFVFTVKDAEHSKRGKTYIVTRARFEAGLRIMAEKHAGHFADMVQQEGDAVTADVLLQCVAMHEVIYG
jgi:hypothetical protein